MSAPPPLMFLSLFFFNDTATTEIYTLSLHDALPISGGLPLLADGPRRDQRLHRGGPGRLWLDARRRRRRHAARRDREPRAALPPVVDQALGALPRADRDPPDPSERHARSGGAAEGLLRLLALAICAEAPHPSARAAPQHLIFLATLIGLNRILTVGVHRLS